MPPPVDLTRRSDLADGFVAVVTGQGMIAVTGEDAASFLHSQLTNDVEHLGDAEARLAGYCSPKGRLQASFLMWRNAESVFLQLPRRTPCCHCKSACRCSSCAQRPDYPMCPPILQIR